MPIPVHEDCDLHTGACEVDDARVHQYVLNRQLPHRTEDEMIKDADSDFPEPGFSPEHS